MNIGTPVLYHTRDRHGPVTRAAIVSEVSFNEAQVNITVFMRPIQDMLLERKEMITTEVDVPYFQNNDPPPVNFAKWCGPIATTKPETLAPIVVPIQDSPHKKK